MATLYISPTGGGLRDGSSVANAGILSDLPAFVGAAGPDGEVLLIADQGAYKNGSEPLSIVNGGTDGHPVTIRGVDSDGEPMQAEIVGRRVDPYVAGASSGEEVFRLLSGSDNLTISDLSFTNISYAAIRVGADISNLTIEHVAADNVQRFLENFVSGDAKTATISGLTVRDVQVDGFSKGVIRLQYDTHDVLIEDVRGDSQRQNGDNFAIGVHLGGTVHDVEFHRVVMRNAFDNVSGAYWQGDGFASERDVYNVLFEDTISSGNTDAGYDLKSSSTTLIRAVAENNGRNFRLWGKDVLIEDAVSVDPAVQGGIANQQHFGFARGADVAIVNPYVSDSSTKTTAFDLSEGFLKVSVTNALVHLDPGAKLTRAGQSSVLTITGTENGVAITGEGVADFSADTAGVFVHGDGAAQFLIGGAGKDVLEGGGGDDALDGGAGDDRLFGGAGDDVLAGGAGRDILIGGAGFDVADYRAASAGIDLDLVVGAPGGDAAGDLIEGIEGLVGSAFDDGLRGDGGANLLVGGEGADRLDGRDGDDLLAGGAGADRLIGGEGIDTADYSGSLGGVFADLGGAAGSGGDAEGDVLSGIEVVIGSAFNDFLQGGAGDDLLAGGAGRDELHGGDGTDTVDFGDNADAVSIDLTTGESRGGDAEGDHFVGIEIIRGSSYADTLIGDGDANVFQGADGNDSLDGAGGDDRLIGDAGADALTGGDGVDTVDYAAVTSAVTVDLSTGTASGGDADGDTLRTIENVIGTGFADTLIGDAVDNRFEGGAGDDLLIGGAGADALFGGSGVDTASYVTSLAGVTLNGSGGAGDAAGDTLDGIEIVVGSAFADDLSIGAGILSLHGAAGDDVLRGGAGNDLLDGGTGADTLSGGAGFDTADYSASEGGVSVDLALGFGSDADAEGDVLQDIERIVGSRFADVLQGGTRDDVLIGGGGADILRGGDGLDTVDYAASTAAVTVDLSTGTGTGGDADGDTYADIDVIIGSAFGDHLVGDGFDNRFVGGTGADAIEGGAGRDVADYSASAVAVRVDLSTGSGSGGDADGDAVTGIEDVIGSVLDDALTGDAGGNRLVGGKGKDSLDGGGGDDEMAGGLGDDLYTVDSLGDVIVEDVGAGSDKVLTALSTYTLGANLESLGYTGTGLFAGYGNGLNNSFSGTAGTETFYGLDGDDRFFGSAGADTFYGGAGANSADYSKSKTSITINLFTNVNLKGDAEGDLLYGVTFISGSDVGDSLTGGSGSETIYGRGGADLLYGLDGDDYLDGGAGADRMEGGAGNDTYLVDVVTDQVIEEAGAGIDTLRTSLATYTLGDNFEKLIHIGTRAFIGTGNGLDNELTGASVGDTLSGGGGNDILTGRGGADLLDGGEGIDTASYAASTVGVTADLSRGGGFAGEAQGDAFVSIENLLGSGRADLLTGDEGDNRIDGGGDDDRLSGGGGNDVLAGNAGKDLIDGAAGLDVAEFSGKLTDYTLTLSGGAIVARDLRVGSPDGVDTVSNVEVFRFADRSVSVEALIRIILERPPSDLNLSGTNVAENAAAGTVVGTALGFDENADDDLLYGLVDDAGGRFLIDPVSGVLSLAEGAVFDHETEASVGVTIVARDPGGLSYSETFAITVTDVNEVPTAVFLEGRTVVENASAGTVVGVATGSDPDLGEALRYALIDDAGGRFAIDPETGVLTTTAGAILDHETVPGYAVDILVRDSRGASFEQTFAIAVTDVNEAPTGLTLSGSTVLEGSAGGTLVGTVAGSDPDIGDVLGYSLVDDAGGRFTIDAATGELRVAAGASIAAVPAGYAVAVSVQDAAGASYVQTSTIGVTPLPPADPFRGDAPDAKSSTFIVDTRPGGASGSLALTNFGTKDVFATTKKIPDGNNDGIITFGAGGVLTLSPAKVTIKAVGGAAVTSLEYDGAVTKEGVQYFIYSRIGSAAGVADATFPSRAPSQPDTLMISNAFVAENMAGAVVGTATAHDPQPGATLRYALVDDAGGRFTIDAATGTLRVAAGTSLDFEAASNHAIVISVTNATGASLQKSFTVTVGDMNEAPTGLVLAGGKVDEGSAAGTIVGTVSGIDPDAGDTSRYALVDDAGGRFAIDGETGVIRVAGRLDYEAQASHAIVVQVVDSQGLTLEKSVTIAIQDVAETYAGTAGADTFVAASDENWIVSGQGENDTLTTLGGADMITGGAGDDVITAGGGNDVIRVSGLSDGYDQVDGGAGDDEIVALIKGATIGLRALSGVETINANGFTGVTIRGSGDADVLDLAGVRLTGIERIVGAGGNDTIIGSAGADIIAGGAGDDVLAGGGGNDVFQLYLDSGRDTIDGGDGFDTIRAEAHDSVFIWGQVSKIESITANGFARVTISGTASSDTIDLTGIALTDIRGINAGDGADVVTGSAGADIINGGVGNDVLKGEAGADIFILGNGAGNDTIDGGADYDTIKISKAGTNLIWTGISAVEAVDATGVSGVSLVGGAADDLIDVSSVALINIPRIDGGGGADQIFGSAVADIIAGGQGRDTLTGNGGSDIFDFDAATDSGLGAGADLILDFAAGLDRIDLSTIDASTKASGNQAFVYIGTAAFTGTAGQLRIDIGDAAVTKILGDVDGNGVADFEIDFFGHQSITAGDFIV